MWVFGVIFAIFGVVYLFGRTTWEIGNKFTTERKSLPWSAQRKIIELARPVKKPQSRFSWDMIHNLNASENKWLYDDIQEDMKYIFRHNYREHMEFRKNRMSFTTSSERQAPDAYSVYWLEKLLAAKYFGVFEVGVIGTAFGGRLLDSISCDHYACFQYYIPPARTIITSTSFPKGESPDEDCGWIIIRYLQRISYYLDKAGKGEICKFVSNSGSMVDFPEMIWVNGEKKQNRSKPTISGSLTLEIIHPTVDTLSMPYTDYCSNPEYSYVDRVKFARKQGYKETSFNKEKKPIGDIICEIVVWVVVLAGLFFWLKYKILN